MAPSGDLDGSLKGAGHSERIDPTTVPRGILSIHRVRYEFALPYCEGRRVVDVACGAGYGSAIVAAVARRIVGIDIDPEAIAHARRHFALRNVDFVHADAARLPFRDESVDVVLSFETIEHLPDIPRYLAEVRRVLVPAGVYLVSTPRVRKTTSKPRNPHHHVELSAADFSRLLEGVFGSVELYGQTRVQSRRHALLQKVDVFHLRRWLPVAWRHAAVRGLGTVPFEEMDSGDQRISASDVKHAHDLVAVARK
jgi:SAM-dependent methyltransferase